MPLNVTRFFVKRCSFILSLLVCLPYHAFAQDAPVEPHEPPAADEEAVEPQAETPTTSEAELLRAADAITVRVGEIRGLEATGPVKKGVKKRDELRAVLIEKLAEEVSDETIEAEAKFFKRLGVIPQDLDYKKVLLDILTEQIAGFYDQKSKELYIMEGIPLGLQRPAMAHEIFHAIQDQHFDILAMQEPFSTVENSDFALARSALLEGDATVLMFDFSMYEQGQLPQGEATSLVDVPFAANLLTGLSFNDLLSLEQFAGSFGGAGFDVGDSALARAPAIFREMLVFPYFAGMRFIVMARSGRTWAEIDAIYEDPPVSTEQILHPEKYFEGDDPVHVSFDVSKALPGYDRIYDSVLGEFQVLQIVKAHGVEGVDSAAAAAGWDGDRAMAYEGPDGQVYAVIMTTWDSIDEAEEFFDSTTAIARSRYPEAQPQTADGEYGESLCLILDGERLYIERWGEFVLYVEGTPSALDAEGRETNPATYHVRDLAWRTLKTLPFDQHYEQRVAEKRATTDEP